MKSTYNLTDILLGKNGNALKGLMLTTLNFEISRQISNHPSLKMPTSRPDSPDDMRALLTLPELEGRELGQRLDVLVDGLVATCALIKDLAMTSDYDASGRITHPFRYLLDRARTPASCIQSNYDWRADMAAKVAEEQAQLIGVKDTKAIGDKARERNKAENQERINFALAEINSHTNLNLMQEDEINLIDLLVDLNQNTFNALKLAHVSASNEITRAKKRLEAGLYTNIDTEIILFAKSTMIDDEV
jgi:hypothetical protein